MRNVRDLSSAFALAVVGALGFASGPSALAANVASGPALAFAMHGDVVSVRETRKHYRRHYVAAPAYAVPRSAPGCPGLYSWNPYNPDRGYCDPGFAYHGNVSGCASDLGYGRWESCNTPGSGVGVGR